MADREFEDVNERVEAEWVEETTPFERVAATLEQTHEGQSAARIAERARVSEPTARRHLESLVQAGFGTTGRDGRTTLYRRDEAQVLLSRIQELRAEADRDAILEGIREMKAEIRSFEEEYDAVSPVELARRLDDGTGDAWADVTRWQTTRRNLAIAQAALAFDEARDLLAA